MTEVPAKPPEGVPEGEVDSLYGLPLEQFTKARNELAGELRSRGQREAADWVGALTKPSASAWAVNQVMRTQRKDARALLEAGERLRKAHADVATGAADAQELRRAADAERAAVGRLSQAARGLTNANGRGLSETILDRVTETLHAISADSETRSLAQVGRLARESRAIGAGELVAPATRGRRGRAVKAGLSKAQLPQARERLERAQREVRKLRSARTRAARRTSDAERALSRAREQMRAVEVELEGKDAEVEKLRRDLEQLR